MMNLRDLIYSQQSESVPVSQVPVKAEEEQPTTTQEGLNRRPFSQLTPDIQDDASSSAADEEEDNAQQKKKIRTSAGATKSVHKVAVYGDKPSVRQQIQMERDRRFGARLPSQAPGLLSAARFPQRSTPILSFERDVVRQLWYRCYFAKDFEGAAMALSVLSEIEPLTPADVSASAQLLRYSDTAAASAKKLVQGILKPLSRDPDRRHAAIAMGIELLLAQNEVKVARKLLQEHVIEFTTLDKQQLVAYDTLVTIASAVLLAQDVCKVSTVALKVPCIEDIINDPLEFSKCIKIINTARTTASFANPRLKGKRQECNQMMRDLKAAFGKSVVGGTAAHDRMDKEAFYLAFLHGSGHESKALRYLSNLKRSVAEAVKGTHPATVNGVWCMYHQLCARYLTRYRYVPPEPEITEVRGMSSNQDDATRTGAPRTGNATFTRIVNTLLKKRDHQVQSTSTALHLYEATLLHSIQAIPTESYLTELCNMIEMAGNPSGCDPYSRDQNVVYAPLQYVLWRNLTSGLGPVSRVIARNAPISSDSEISKYIPTAAVKLPGRTMLKPGVGYQPINPLSTSTTTTSNNGGGTDTMLSPTATVTVELAGSSTSTVLLSDVAANPQPALAAQGESPSTQPPAANTHAVLSGREWWASSILSAAQLDSFTVSTVDLAAASEYVQHMHPSHGSVSGVSSTPPRSSGAVPPLVPRADNHSEISSAAPVLDTYDRWLAAEKEFTVQLGELFAVRHRTMSEDLSGDDSDASEKDLGEGTGGGASGAVDAEDSHTSHDDAEYHSNESEYEVAKAGINVETPGKMPNAATAYTYHKDVLGFATGSIDAYNVLQESALLQRMLPPTVLLDKANFAVQRVKTSTLTGSEKPNSLAARQARPVIQFILGDRVLEMLAYQAVVRAHMHTQDNLFTIRAVQIAMFHALRSAASCINNSGGAGYAVRFLVDSRIDIERALKIGAFLGKRGVDPAISPPRYYDLSADLTVLGASVCGQYCPA